MGTRGPAPKRSDQRRRTNKPAVPVEKAETPVFVPPPPDETWHKAATMFYESLGQSGQSCFYTASDWTLAWITAESLSRELGPKPVGTLGRIVESAPIGGASMQSFLKACSMLLVSEGDRRRVSLELQRAKAGAEEVSDVSELARYRQRLQSS